MNNKIMSKVVASTLLVSMVGYTIPVFAYTKDETVYSKLDASGNNYKTVVSEHLKNSEDAELINDLSNLLNVTNTNGEETFTQDGNKFTWDAKGNDIYYQGDTEKELPIDCNIKYELDGKEISKDELAGKSGKLKIDLQYTNKEKRVVTVNGKNVNVYVPFVVVAGTMIKNEKAQNIEVSTGKVVDDGSKTLVVGLAMPGLQESLGISKNDIDIPSNVEITMDVTDFEMQSIVTYVTPKVFGNDDLKAFDELDKIYADVNKLQSASNQILTGATALNDGASKVNDGAKQLKDGINTAYNGSSTIKSEVDKAISAQKNDKTDALDNATLDSIEKTAEQSAQLTTAQKDAIAKQAAQGATLDEKTLEAIAQQALTQVGTIKLTDTQKAQIKLLADKGVEAQAETIKKGADSQVDTLLTAITNSVTTKLSKVEVTSTEVDTLLAKEGFTAENLVKLGLTPEQIKALSASLNSENIAKSINTEFTNKATKALAVTEAEKNEIKKEAENSAIASAKEIAETAAINAAEASANQTAGEVATQVAKGTAQNVSTQVASKTATTVAQTTATTTAKATSRKVASQVGNQVKKVAQSNVISSMTTLSNGLGTLSNGLEQINNGASDLQNGTNSLAEGSAELKDGIQQFNEDGIKKLCNLINGDVKSVADRAEKLNELSKEYNSFTMLDKDAEGEVKFIMITDQIKKQTDAEQDKEQAVLNNDENSSDENK